MHAELIKRHAEAKNPALHSLVPQLGWQTMIDRRDEARERAHGLVRVYFSTEINAMKFNFAEKTARISDASSIGMNAAHQLTLPHIYPMICNRCFATRVY